MGSDSNFIRVRQNITGIISLMIQLESMNWYRNICKIIIIGCAIHAFMAVAGCENPSAKDSSVASKPINFDPFSSPSLVGRITGLLVDSDKIFVSTLNDGVFFSKDGLHFTRIKDSPENAQVFCIAKGKAGSILAGTDDGQIFESDSVGPFRLIANISEPKPECAVYALAWMQSKLFIGAAAGFYEWQSGFSAPRPLGVFPRCRCILEINPSTVAMGLYGNGIRFLSPFYSSGPRSGTEKALVLSLAQDPSNPSVILAGLDGGMLLSKNGGKSFKEVERFPRSLAVRDILKIDKDEWLAATERGLYERASDGEWRVLQLPASRFTCLAKFHQRPWVGTDGMGIFILSPDGSYNRIPEGVFTKQK